MNQDECANCDAALDRIREAECEICRVVLNRIQQEIRDNFVPLGESRPYGKEKYHKIARAQYSFENMVKAMHYLSHVLEFRDEAIELAFLAYQELIRPIDEREAGRILAVIEQLEPRLQKRIRA